MGEAFSLPVSVRLNPEMATGRRRGGTGRGERWRRGGGGWSYHDGEPVGRTPNLGGSDGARLLICPGEVREVVCLPPYRTRRERGRRGRRARIPQLAGIRARFRARFPPPSQITHRKNSSDMTSGCCENCRPLKPLWGFGERFFFLWLGGSIRKQWTTEFMSWLRPPPLLTPHISGLLRKILIVCCRRARLETGPITPVMCLTREVAPVTDSGQSAAAAHLPPQDPPPKAHSEIKSSGEALILFPN